MPHRHHHLKGSNMIVVATAEAVVLLLLLVLVAGLLRSHAEILRALHDLGGGRAAVGPVSVAAPARPDGGGHTAADITGESPDGDVLRLGVGNGEPMLLAFLTTGCTACRSLWESFVPEAVPDLVGRGRVVLVTRGPADESAAAIAALAPAGATTVMSDQAWIDYGPPAAPYFVLVDGAAHVIGEGSAPSWDRAAELMRRAHDDGVNTRALSRRELLSRR
jgi:hypothetical protein